MRRFSLLLLVFLAACSGPSVAGESPSGAGSWSPHCAAQKASCDILG